MSKHMSGPGVWEPTPSVSVSRELLDQYLGFSQNLELTALDKCFPEAELGTGAKLMKLQASDWQVAEQLSDQELEQLVRFFTLAEMQLSGWDAGKTSPVIYLVKMLKKRGAFAPELKKWIKANTDNRFLPNGAIAL